MSMKDRPALGLAALGVLTLLLASGCPTKKKSPKDTPAEAPQKDTPTAEIVIPSIDLPDDPAADLGLDSKVKTGTLANGLTYYIRENGRPEKRAQFWIAIDAGSYQETDDQQGLAHFVEHMAFNGTKSFPKNELIGKLRELGVEFGPHINASTSFDETIYKLRLPTDDQKNIDLGLHILSEWAGALTFDPTEVEAERGVVLAEKRSGDGPEMRLVQSIIKEVFVGTRYADRLPIGKPEVLKTASVETIKQYYEDWYHPANMAIFVVGDIDATAIEKKIKKQFGALPAKKDAKVAAERKLPKRDALKYLSLRDKELPVSAVALGRLVKSEPTASLNDYRRDYLEVAVAQMLTKRLEEAKQRKGARFMTAAGAPAPLVRSSKVMAFFAMVDPSDAKGGLEDLLTEIERARQHGFTSTELARANEEILTILRSRAKEDAAGKEVSNAIVAELVRHHLNGDGMPGRATEVAIVTKLIQTITVDDLRGVLEGYLDPAGLLMANIGPPSETALSEEDVSKLLAGLKDKKLEAYVDENADTPLMATEPTAGTIKETKHYPEVDVHEWVLSNGAHVILKETDFKEDEILFRATSPGGTSMVSNAELPALRRTGDLIEVGGLGDHDAIRLDKILAGKNAGISAYVGTYAEGLRGRSGVNDLETLLQLAHLKFAAPRKDENAVSIYVDQELKAAQLSRNKPEVRFTHKLVPWLSNKNPRRVVWDETAVKALDLDKSLAFYQDRMQGAGDFRFLLVGNFKREEIKPLILKYLGSLPDNGRKEKFARHPWPAHVKRKVLEQRDSTEERASLSIFFDKEVDASASDRKELASWRLFGNAAEMRFLKLFREEMSETYGVRINTGWSQRWSHADMTIGFQCAPKRAKALLALAEKEIAAVVSEGVSEEHFAKAKEAALKAYETDLKDNGYWLNRLDFLLFNDRKLSEILDYATVIKALTVEDLKATAGRLIDVKKPVIGLLLPKK